MVGRSILLLCRPSTGRVSARQMMRFFSDSLRWSLMLEPMSIIVRGLAHEEHLLYAASEVDWSFVLSSGLATSKTEFT